LHTAKVRISLYKKVETGYFLPDFDNWMIDYQLVVGLVVGPPTAIHKRISKLIHPQFKLVEKIITPHPSL
jgi:hypothetical protein